MISGIPSESFILQEIRPPVSLETHGVAFESRRLEKMTWTDSLTLKQFSKDL